MVADRRQMSLDTTKEPIDWMSVGTNNNRSLAIFDIPPKSATGDRLEIESSFGHIKQHVHRNDEIFSCLQDMYENFG